MRPKAQLSRLQYGPCHICESHCPPEPQLCLVRAFLLCHGRGRGNPLHWRLQVHTQQARFDFCCLQQGCGATGLEACIPALRPASQPCGLHPSLAACIPALWPASQPCGLHPAAAPTSALLLISLHSWPSYPHRTVPPTSDSPGHSAFYPS